MTKIRRTLDNLKHWTQLEFDFKYSDKIILAQGLNEAQPNVLKT